MGLLDGKVFLITGGGRGIGREVALPSGTVYALFDGLLQNALLGLHTGDPGAAASLQEAARRAARPWAVRRRAASATMTIARPLDARR